MMWATSIFLDALLAPLEQIGPTFELEPYIYIILTNCGHSPVENSPRIQVVYKISRSYLAVLSVIAMLFLLGLQTRTPSPSNSFNFPPLVVCRLVRDEDYNLAWRLSLRLQQLLCSRVKGAKSGQGWSAAPKKTMDMDKHYNLG